MAWVAFVKKTGLTPLSAGQWKPFLAFYAGLWTMQNFLRPLRLSLAIALAPLYERLIQKISDWTGLGRKQSFAVVIAGIAVCTLTYMGLALWLLGGFNPAPQVIL